MQVFIVLCSMVLGALLSSEIMHIINIIKGLL